MQKHDIDRYITDNINISDQYFKDLLTLNYGELNIYIALHYVYFLLKKEMNAQAQYEFEKIGKAEKYISFRLMIEGMIEHYILGNENGIQKLKESYNLDNSNKWVRLELFYVTLNTEDDYKAWGYLEEAIKIDRDYNEAIFRRLTYYDTIENCNQIISEILQFPQTYIDAEILNTLAFAYYNCFEIENSKKILRGSLDIEETGRALYLSGLIAQEEGDTERAIKYYDKSYAIEPGSDVLSAKAWILFQMDKFDAAEDLLLRSLKLEQNEDNLHQIIEFYLKTKNLERVNFYIGQSSIEVYDFMDDGYKIIRDYVFNLSDIKLLVKEYSLKYTEKEVAWLKEIYTQYAG
jgi:tetratricopeptide (TPR) repeat protein